MNVYSILVTYVISYGGTTTSNTFTVMRKANSASSAISTISALFGALSNYKSSDGTPFLRVTQVMANLVSSDSSDEPEPDVTPENTDSEDNTNSEE